MNSAVYFVGCLLMWGLAVFNMKVVGDRIDPMTSVVFNTLGYLLTASFFVPRMSFTFTRYHLLAMAIGTMFVLGNLSFYKLTQTRHVSLLAPLTSLNVAIPIILGIVVLGEPMTVRKAIGILLAVSAIYLLSSA